MQRKLLSLLSIAQKAGKIISGEETVEKTLKKGNVKVLFVCSDASENTKSKFDKKAFFYKVPFFIGLTKDELNKSIGRANRTTIAIEDENFAKEIIKYFKAIEIENQNF